MAVKTDSPQIVSLRNIVEKRFGHPIEGRSDFSLLAIEIERITHDHIAENTLRRLWGRISGYETVFTRTLDVLCRYVGHEHWNAFCQSLQVGDTFECNVMLKNYPLFVDNLVHGGEHCQRYSMGLNNGLTTAVCYGTGLHIFN